MLKLLILLTQQLSGIFSPDFFIKKESTETKKCMNCLQRVELDRYRCPYCGCSDYHFSAEWLNDQKC